VGRVIVVGGPKPLGRPWGGPGTPGLMHRMGGLEKDIRTGNISYDPANHQAMTKLRADKVAAVAKLIPPQTVEIGNDSGVLAVVGWGSTYGAIYQAVRLVRDPRVAHIHLRYLSPFPSNLGELLRRFERILVPEMNMGQLASLLRDKLGVETVQLNKVTGQPFLVSEIVAEIRRQLAAVVVGQSEAEAAAGGQRPRRRTGRPKAIRGDRA